MTTEQILALVVTILKTLASEAPEIQTMIPIIETLVTGGTPTQADLDSLQAVADSLSATAAADAAAAT